MVLYIAVTVSACTVSPKPEADLKDAQLSFHVIQSDSSAVHKCMLWLFFPTFMCLVLWITHSEHSVTFVKETFLYWYFGPLSA